MPTAIGEDRQRDQSALAEHLHDLADEHALHQRQHTPMNANTKPIVDAVKPNFASLNSANVASNPENASVTMKYSASSSTSVGLVSACRNASMRPRFFVAALTDARLRQQEPRGDEVGEAQRRREPHRRLRTEAAQHAADRRTEDEPEPERRADHAHALARDSPAW